MEQRSTWLFVVLIIFSFLLVMLDRLNILSAARGGIDAIIAKTTGGMHSLSVNKLTEEPLEERSKLLELERLEKENEDLRTQLGIVRNSASSQKLIPASVLATSRFFIIDKGEKDGVRVGNTVVFKNIFIGKIVKVVNFTSRVLLPTEEDRGIKAKTEKTGAIGLVKGRSDKIVLSEVTLSEKLMDGDTALTIGDLDEEGLGVRPNLLLGELHNIQKSSDPLFQEAIVSPPLDYKNLETVFIVL